MKYLALASLVLALVPACGGSRPRPAPPGEGAAVVPVGEGAALVFTVGLAQRLEGVKSTPFEATLPAGAPLAAANDPSSGWSVVAYRDALLVVNASEARVKRIDGVDWQSPPEALGVGGTTIGTLEDGTIALYDALEGRRLWKEDGRALLERLGLKELRHVMPVSRDRMLVVAYKEMSALEHPKAMVVDLDRSSGLASAQERPFGNDLHSLEACAGDGSHLYVAGTTQVVENTGPRQQQMTKTIVVLRHDPAKGRNQVLVRSRQAPGTEVEVALLAAGSGLLAYALADGRVNVYDVTAERDSVHLWGRPIEGLGAITCIDASHVAFTVGARTTIERVR